MPEYSDKTDSLPRVDCAVWAKNRIITWATHLNDLRLITEKVSAGQLLAELKLLCLFYGQQVLLADTYLTNNPIFHILFHDDAARIRSAFSNQRLVLAIRGDAPTLSEVNNQQAGKRADPAIHEKAARFAKEFDTYALTHEVCSVSWSVNSASTTFEAKVKTILEHPTLLDPGKKELAKNAISAAISKDPGGRLLFGDAFDFLVRQKGLPVKDPTVQAFRTAYLLNVGLELDIPPAVPMTDLPSDFVDCVLRRGHVGSFEGIEPKKELGLLPKRVLSDQTLDRISFEDILDLQRFGQEVGYFQALENARSSLGTPQEVEAYVRFLKKLGHYIEAMGRRKDVELIPWQEDLVREKIGQIEARKYSQVMLWWCVPVAIHVILRAIFGINVSLGGLMVTAAGGTLLSTRRARRKRDALESWLKGSARVSRYDK